MDQLYKCGYCGFLLQSQCENLLEHDCLKNIYVEGRHDLVEDEKKVLTLVDKETQQTVGVQGINLGINISFEERLIKFVQERPALYNICLPLMERTNAKKIALWGEIANLFGGQITVEELQRKWKYLRDCYVKARKKTTEYRPSGSEATPLPNPRFRFYDVMKFIDDGATPQMSVSSISLMPSIRASNRAASPTPSTSTQASSPLISPTGSTKSTTSTKRKKNDETNLEKEVRGLLSAAPEKPDGVDGFLLRLGESLRKLPYRERCKLEIDIMNLVYDTECRLDIN